MRTLVGLALTAAVAAVAWFTVGQDVLDKVNESNARSGGGGPPEQRIVSARRFTAIVERLRDEVASEARLVSVTIRPDSVEFVVFQRGRASGYRYSDGRDGLQRFEVGGAGHAGRAESAPWPMALLDPKAPQRITRAISTAERGDFLLSIGDLERASSGKVVWVMRGRIGERGIAYSAPAEGSRIKPYDPSSPELSAGARLGQCIQRAQGDPAGLQRCVRLYGPN
jgi:hypothetical protein